MQVSQEVLSSMMGDFEKCKVMEAHFGHSL